MYPSLCQLFPNFESELAALGGKVLPPHSVIFRGAGFLQMPDANRDNWPVRQLYISREAFEALLRRLILKNHGNVRTDTALVTRLHLANDGSQKVAGVGMRYPDGRSTIIDTALVVDASGVASAGDLPRQ